MQNMEEHAGGHINQGHDNDGRIDKMNTCAVARLKTRRRSHPAAARLKRFSLRWDDSIITLVYMRLDNQAFNYHTRDNLPLPGRCRALT